MANTAFAVADMADNYRKMLRTVLATHPGPLPRRIEEWWVAEQKIMAEEAAAIETRKAQRRAELEATILSLQKELATL